MEEKLHTPEGVRDIYSRECEIKLTLQKKLNQVLHLYGYEDIQTPTFEYYDVFREEIGSTSTQELYKFFDRDGNILSLRPDITPSVARAAATLFDTEEFPLRFCYVGNTFINHSSYRGRLKENTQLGAELIGLDSVEADAEMIAMVADALKKAGLEEFQISIGHVDFLQSILSAARLDDETAEHIRELIGNRNFFGAEELLEEKKADETVRKAFSILPELMGTEDALDKVEQFAIDEKAKSAVARLRQISHLLQLYHASDHVTFDLSMSGGYGYYTGIVFRVYTYGTGDAIVRGGRYNHLLEKFGKETPSIGFAIIVDELMSALSRQKISVETTRRNIIVYTEKTESDAIILAGSFRQKGRCIELIKQEKGKDRSAYEAYAKRKNAAALICLSDEKRLEMMNLITGEKKTADIAK